MLRGISKSEDQASDTRVSLPHARLAVPLSTLVFPLKTGARLAPVKFVARRRNRLSPWRCTATEAVTVRASRSHIASSA